MADVQVTCIRKPDPQSAHEHITHVGGDGRIWSREQVIGWIGIQQHSFYTLDAKRRRADIGVVYEAGKAPFLRTYADGEWNDNLLSLPQCPVKPA
jgi:hypothetical protein